MSDLIKESLHNEIEAYWNRRSESYSEEVRYELEHDNKEKWFSVIAENLSKKNGLNVLDIGTGPGFFAIGLTEMGHKVTAIDCTEGMLRQAKNNADKLAEKITFLKMNAQCLEFPDESFDLIVTRNVTWNLQNPQVAYKEWCRVLKKGGVLLNFDAAWYSYIYDEEKERGHQEDIIRVEEQQVKNFDAYEESSRMEEIARDLLFSRFERPAKDMELLKQTDFSDITVDTAVGERVWSDVEKINYVSRPLFMIRAVK